MNSKMTTNSQLPTTESKKQKQKQTKQMTRTGTEPQNSNRNGDHMEGYQQGSGRMREGEKVQGIRSIIGRLKIDRGG